jgi:glutathione S-transferase
MMKLRYASTSPFVRKVLVTAIETGQDSEIECVKTNTADPELVWINPLSKIPALELGDGSVLIDSAVICEFLDSRKGGKLFPKDGSRWPTLSRMALCDGVLDAAVLRRYESLRPETLRSIDWDTKQKTKVDQVLDALEKEVPGFGDRVDIGTLTVAITLDYLDFRFAHEKWRDSHPALAKWHAAISPRPSLKATMPTD